VMEDEKGQKAQAAVGEHRAIRAQTVVTANLPPYPQLESPDSRRLLNTHISPSFFYILPRY
jgi:hypothetical protein